MSFKDCSVFKQMNEDLNTEINNLEPANKTILSLVRAGFDLESEPFFRGVLETMKKNGYNQLKNKCNIRVEKSARIIGVIFYLVRSLMNLESWKKMKFIAPFMTHFPSKKKAKNLKLLKKMR